MTRSHAVSTSSESVRQRRFGPTPGAFVIGLPLAAGILFLIHLTPEGSVARRYVSHPVEFVEVGMFCCAIGALLSKVLALIIERAAFRLNAIPPWDGKVVAVSEAAKFQSEVERQPRWMQSTYLGRRVSLALEFLCKRASATSLDDQLRTLADNDAFSLESSYSLTRFFTWAMPILGFLGTVLGITAAISGVTPEELEKGLNKVTDGLALAFDATALALALTMLVMFLSFIVERLEQRLLEAVDRWIDRELAHRFERTGSAGSEVVESMRQQGQAILQATEQLVEKQAAIWAKALDEANRRRADMEADFRKQLGAALESALERTQEAQSRRLADQEKQAAGPTAALVDKLGALAKVADGLKSQAEVLGRLQDGEKQLVRLQQQLQENLASLADAGAFQQAVHSLTAAIHLLTAQASQSGMSRRPGAAA
jgi:biopolymer transport protein ExbB/TolQ